MIVTVHDRWDEIKKAAPRLALVPFASVEQHGPHLPLETDALILEAVAVGVAKRMPGSVYLLPAIPAGTTFRNRDFGGTISLRTETLVRVVKDTAWSLRQHGIDRMVFFSNVGLIRSNTWAPDENIGIQVAVRDLTHDDPRADFLWCQPAPVAQQRLQAIFPGWQDDINGGDFETSCIRHLAPDLVKGTPRDFVPTVDPMVLQAVSFRRVSPTGVWGHPSRATAEKGRQAVDAMIDATATYVTSVLKHVAAIKTRSYKPSPPYP